MRAVEIITNAVLDIYLRDRRAKITVAVLVAFTGLSEAQVRRALPRCRELDTVDSTVPTYSRNYPGMEHGTARVTCYRPSREWLAQLLIAARKEGGAS